jgi:hypothetical protein
LHPGALVDGGDGVHGVRGKNIEGDARELTHEEKLERNLIKHSEDTFKVESKKAHGKNGHGSKNAKILEQQLRGRHEKHGHDQHLSMHDRAHVAMMEKSKFWKNGKHICFWFLSFSLSLSLPLSDSWFSYIYMT